MSEHDFRVGTRSTDPGEPAVRHPGLQALVKAARMQQPPAVQVRAETVLEGWQRRRATQRRGIVAALAMAAALVLVVSTPELWKDHEDHEVRGSAAPIDDPKVAVSEAEVMDTTRSTPPGETSAPVEPRGPVLATTIVVQALAANVAQPEILGPRHLRLPEGRWSIDSQSAEPVTVELPDGPIEVRGGALHVKIAGHEVHVTVLREAVDRVDLGGLEVASPIESVPTESNPPARPASQSAAELAREAEQRMAAGDRQGAIRSLRRLVTKHPRSAAAQAGLIDLGRLLKAAGHEDEARCAYAEFLERWPGHALTGDVLRAKRALGDGPACDGLAPKSAR
ncbi:tetratricopeptide repeat protein [Paraliomyxa miuraensis]|uniref:tetratricopeptide repeat protein n=1 Tax=Paraliomyxa miuraensis TaxID=376150 RepID=UPI002258139C|nr:hypothetical protein [Paraliomyxa miuraensis]MCX4245126.1 hypothetical protein [Paraliomyxa miuraensis]